MCIFSSYEKRIVVIFSHQLNVNEKKIAIRESSSVLPLPNLLMISDFVHYENY